MISRMPPNSAMESDAVGMLAPLASPPRGSSPAVERAEPEEPGGSWRYRMNSLHDGGPTVDNISQQRDT